MVDAIEISIEDDEYEEMLNELYGTVTVCGMEYDAGTVLKEVDPIAFRCGVADEPIKWQCGECDTIFDDRDGAEECCEEEEDP